MKIFVHGLELDRGGYPKGCPFDSRRAGMALEKASAMGLLSGPDRAIVAPEPASRTVLERFHMARYLDALLAAGHGSHDVEALSMGIGSPDCPVFQNMYEYVALAAGGTTTAARQILAGKADVAFAASGGFHHAHPAEAAGFCYLNDVVLAALELTDRGRRVAFLDVDVHHCDGVQAAFYERRDVFTISLHESGRTLFPGTGFEDEIGRGDGLGHTVNLPLPAGTYDEIYLRAIDEAVMPLIRAYDPDVIMVELGMDGLAGDPLAHLALTNNVYAEVLERLLGMGRPILATGGGGYHVENTVRGWVLCWSVLCGDQTAHDAMSFGMGGVMLENLEWSGGLRDRVLVPDSASRSRIDPEVLRVVDRVQRLVFPHHGL